MSISKVINKIQSYFKAQSFISYFDAIAAAISLPISYVLRYDSIFAPEIYDQQVLKIYLIAFLFKLAAFRYFGVSKAIWRFIGTKDFVRLFSSLLMATVGFVITLFIWNRVEGLPRSVIFIDLLIGMSLLGGARLLYRIYFERQSNFKDYSSKILLIGAGNAGAQLIKDAIVDGRNRIQIVAIFDDNPKTHGRSIQGITVVGPTNLIGEYASDHNVNDVVIAIPSASAQQMRQLVNLCAEFKLRVKTLPAVTDLIEGKVELSNVRPLNITDLLAREQIELDTEQVNILINEKVVMVTGAGGSIGSELCAQILRHAPAKLILFETCEFFIYKTERTLREKFSHIEIVPVVGDVRDNVRVENTLAKYRPDILFHAAAYKHVPMMELNPEEAIKTNVGGTAIVSSLANKYKVARFVMVSSDKAVNPTNIMGATKRVAEMLCLEQNAKGPTHFTIIRFGNVLGSAGSVIPLFQEQIRNGGPVTVTHPEVTRYFMSIPEATQLVLQACSLGNGGEIFVLEMGKPVKIADLAKDLIRLSGFEPEIDIRIEYTGLRPGEKLYEELLTDNEHTSATSHNLVRRALLQKNPENFNMLLDRLIGSVNEEKHIKNILRELVPEYKIYQNEQGHENSKSQ